MQWVAEKKIPFVMVFTKGDKLGKNALTQNIETYKNEMLKQWEELPQVFITSAEKKEGIEEITKLIKRLNSQFKSII